jgi:hypothetical protein
MNITTLQVTLVHSKVTNRVFSYLYTVCTYEIQFLYLKTCGINSCTFRKTISLTNCVSVVCKITFKILLRSKIFQSGCKILYTCQNSVHFCLPIMSKLQNVTDVNCAEYSIYIYIYNFVITLLTLHTTERG